MKRFSETNDDAYVIGFSIPLPILNGYKGQRIEARQNIRKAERQKTAAYLNVRNELNRIHSDLDSSNAKLDIFQQEILPLAEELFQAAKTSYAQGKSDYLTLLVSQKTYFDSKNEYIDILAQYQILRIQLQRLIGRDISAQ
jgi:cobalt-zinc-cadmium efflux system outer membrane protein